MTENSPNTALLVNEGEIGADYIEQFLDILDYDGDIDIEIIGDRTHISVYGGGDELQSLLGKDGSVLEALQELTRISVQNTQGRPSYLMLDILNYRKNIRDEIAQETTRIAKEILESGIPQTLEPMNAFERKIVHDTIAQIVGLSSESHGTAKERHVVISPADE